MNKDEIIEKLERELIETKEQRDAIQKRFEYSSIECSFALEQRDKWRECADGLEDVAKRVSLSLTCHCFDGVNTSKHAACCNIGNAIKALTTYNNLKGKE